MSISIKAYVSFFDYGKKIYHNGLIVDFSIREDMLNSGKIEFINKQTALAGENKIEVKIIFAYGELVCPFLKKGAKYIFGEPSFPYGECEVIKIFPCASVGVI